MNGPHGSFRDDPHPRGLQHNGLTYVALNGRESCPTIVIAHGSWTVEQTVAHADRLRAEPEPATWGQDLEWDPPAPDEESDAR